MKAELEIKIDNQVVLGLYTDGMAVGPAREDMEDVRGLLVEALMLVTPSAGKRLEGMVQVAIERNGSGKPVKLKAI